jgi:hypothetical protein
MDTKELVHGDDELLHRDDLPTLLNYNGLCGKGVEVGVEKGEFSLTILKKWEGQKLYLVDAWRHIADVRDLTNPDHNGQLNNLAHTFMNTYEFSSRVCIIRELSTIAADLFADESLDFVYLDAAHGYKFVKADLQAWFPKIRKGGLFCGHDYIEDGIKFDSEFGVKSAVDEFAAEHKLKLEITKEEFQPSWYIWK